MVAELGDPGAEFVVLGATAVLMWEPRNRDDRFAYTLRMVELAEESDDPEDKAEALAWRSVAALNLGLRDQLDADQARHAQLSRTLPQIKVAAQAMRAIRCFIEGHWVEGERLTAGAIESELPQSAAMAMSDALIFMVRAQQGRLAEYAELLEGKDRYTEAWETWPIWHIGMILGLAQSGREDRARELLDEPGRDGLDGAAGQHITMPVYFGAAGLLFAELADSARAEALAEMMEPHTGEWTIFGPAGSTFGPVDLILGEMRLTADQDELAIEPLKAALEMCETMSALPYRARAELALAEALRRTGGDPERAAELREAGKTTALELGMQPVLGWYRPS